jgi:threonine dehydrogenase-like Zn-dependent dehydrogenase
VGQVVGESIKTVGAGGVVCLTGVGTGGHEPGIPIAALATEMVLQNNVVVGSVNANKRHWYKGSEALARADHSWLAPMITRRERPEDFARALHRGPNDIKVVIQFSSV